MARLTIANSLRWKIKLNRNDHKRWIESVGDIKPTTLYVCDVCAMLIQAQKTVQKKQENGKSHTVILSLGFKMTKIRIHHNIFATPMTIDTQAMCTQNRSDRRRHINQATHNKQISFLWMLDKVLKNIFKSLHYMQCKHMMQAGRQASNKCKRSIAKPEYKHCIRQEWIAWVIGLR